MNPCNHSQCGCSYGAPCCLNCPFADCILGAHGRPRGATPWRIAAARPRIAALARLGYNNTGIARILGMDRRTVARYRP